MKRAVLALGVLLVVSAAAPVVHAQPNRGTASRPEPEAASRDYQDQETRELVQLVQDAADLLRTRGEAAFADFRTPGSRWRQDETYIFVLDLEGTLVVHADPELEGKNQLDLKDVNGKPVIRGLLQAATTSPQKPEGWYHYEWPVPNGLLPRWKSTYVRLVKAPSGKNYVVGCGIYNDRMERAFVVDMVTNAVTELEQKGESAFQQFRDPRGPFIAKDAYVFVMDANGVELVNPAFPSLEGRNLMDQQDARGKFPIREMFQVAQSQGSGWVDYMWPKPGESIPTQKSAYVTKAKMGDQPVLVGCGVYLADAPKAVSTTQTMTAPDLMALVREAAAVLAERGEDVFAQFRTQGSKWYRGDTYLFVWTLDGVRTFHAANPESEGEQVSDLKDVLGRPFGRMFLEAAASPSGEGWVHYMYPEPGDIFPAWKSSFIKRVKFPSGEEHLVGCGIYNMQMDKAFIEDVVNRSAALVADRGKEAFAQLRDKTGPFVFMDTYVFVADPDGLEWVNSAQPSLEGKNLMAVRDAHGKLLVKEYIDAAMNEGAAWVDYYWYKPGRNEPALKHTYVRKVDSRDGTYIVGSGFYAGDEAVSGRPATEQPVTAGGESSGP